jgi:enhancer of polycomb-like protein
VDKLKKLRKEIEDGRLLIAMALQREHTKREMLIADRNIFQMRAEVKRNKIKLGIKTDDEDLINQKVCKPLLLRKGEKLTKE